jgi:outer membrane receptor protein involved in Fe transport
MLAVRPSISGSSVSDRPRISALLSLLLLALLHPTNSTAQIPTRVVHISGTIVDTNGSSIQSAQVSLKQNQRTLETTSSDQQGRFELATNELGDLSIEVECPGFDSFTIPLEKITEPLRLVLTPRAVSAEVTITATRTATRLSETAASVVVLNSNDLQTTAAMTLDDTLRQVAGFSLFRRSGSRTANPTSQGVSLRATGASGASRALVLADGIPLNDPFGGWVYWDRVPRESIDQVEVLLGGASHLYGNAALGGVVDVQTKNANANELSLAASYGNETTPNASLFASTTKNGWSGSVAAETFRTNGYVLVPENQSGAVDTAAGSRDAVINLKGEKKITDGARLVGGASFFGESRENGTPLQTNRTHLRQFFFGGSWQPATFGSFSGKVYGGTQVYDQNFSTVSLDRNSEALTRVQRVPAQVFGATSQWSRTMGRRQTFVAGFEAREVRGASDEIVYVNARATSLVGAGGREREAGIYFEDLIRIGSRLFLNLGAREDHWRNYAATSASRPITAASPTAVLVFPDRTENAFSPHGSLVYKLSDQISLMASMSRAFRAPTLNELYRSFRVGNVLTLANENLRAERLTGGEAGVRFTSANEKLALRGNFFWNDITRPIANVTLTSTPILITRQRQNLGRTRSRGMELQADAQLNRLWSVSGSYLFADATVREFPANTTLEGLTLPQVPRHQFTFQTRYSNSKIATVAFQGRASSSQFDDDQNVFRLDPYFTLDAYVSRQVNEHFEIFGAFENVFNQRYEVGKTPVTTLGPPILVRAGLRMRLGNFR